MMILMHTNDTPSENPSKATACIVLADGTTFYGQGFGATGKIAVSYTHLTLPTKA